MGFRKWWRNNNYKFWRIIFFPVLIFSNLKDTHYHKKWVNTQWSKEQAKQVLDRNLYKIVTYTEDGNFTSCWLSYMDNFKIKRKDRIFYKKFLHEINKYFKEEYQIDGYTKTVDGLDVIFEKSK